MRIAVCDDNPSDLRKLTTALSDYLRARTVAVDVTTFTSADTLVEVARKTPFDLYLLDVILGAETGVQVVRELRTKHTSVPVIFFSTCRDYAFDAYGVEAIGYVGKPWTMETFTAQLDKAMAIVGEQAQHYISLGVVGDTRRFRATDIVYVGPSDTANYIRVHLLDGTTVDARYSVKAFADLSREMIALLPVGRSLLINPRQISGLSGLEVAFFTGEKLTLPRSSLPAVREAILKSF